jgi:hypothetical protein
MNGTIQVAMSAVIEDRQWLPNLKTYCGVDDSTLFGDKVFHVTNAENSSRTFRLLMHVMLMS